MLFFVVVKCREYYIYKSDSAGQTHCMVKEVEGEIWAGALRTATAELVVGLEARKGGGGVALGYGSGNELEAGEADEVLDNGNLVGDGGGHVVGLRGANNRGGHVRGGVLVIVVVELGVEELLGLGGVHGKRDDVSVLVRLEAGGVVALQDVLDLVGGVGGKGEDVLDFVNGKVLPIDRRPRIGNLHELRAGSGCFSGWVSGLRALLSLFALPHLLFEQGNSGSIMLEDNLDIDHVRGGGAG